MCGQRKKILYMEEYLLHLQVHLNHNLIENSAIRSFKRSNVIVIRDNIPNVTVTLGML